MVNWRDASVSEIEIAPTATNAEVIGLTIMKNDENAFWSIFGYLLSGLLFWGGLGWLIDKWIGKSYFLLPGLLIGTGVAFYLVWLRFGRN